MRRMLLVGLLLIHAQLAAPAPPQQTSLRILLVTPPSAILPTEPVTITFDRPVVGSLGQTIDAERVAFLEPAVPVRFDWRDPVTLRLVPAQPWTSGSVVTLVIDTTLVALDGSRLTRPVRIPIRIKGPALRATAPGLAATRSTVLPPGGRIRLAYSSDVDTTTFGRISRYEFSADCQRRVIPLRIAAQRPLAGNDWEFLRVVGYDSVVRSMARVVELRPASPLPDGCAGVVVLPSLDSLDATELRYPISAAPAFALSSLTCTLATDCGNSETVALSFTAPVTLDAAKLGVHVVGESTVVVTDQSGANWTTLRLPLTPRGSARISFDSTFTDIAGRPLTGAREISLDVGDRAPRVSHPAGFVTQPLGATPFLRVTHVNVDSVVAELIAMPSTGSAATGAMLGDTRLLWDRPGVTRRVIALGGPLNEVQTTDIPLGELTASPTTQLLAIRLRVRRGKPGLVASVLRIGRTLTTVGRMDTMTTAPAVIQTTNLAVHARVDEFGGVVLVTELRRSVPVRDAVVTLRDARGTALASARTNSSGIALLSSATGLRDVTPSGPYGARPTRVVEVERGGDLALLPVTIDSRNALETGQTGDVPLRTWLGWDHRRRALLFVDRDLYRPGERVYLAAVARDGPVEQLRVPRSGERFRWVVRSHESGHSPRVVLERDAKFTDFGTSADSFDLSPRSPLGYHTAELQREVGGEWSTFSQATFQVKEYRAPEFAVKLTSDTVPHAVGDTLKFRVSGRYFYDAPMRGSAVRWSATISKASPWELRIPSLPPGFGFGDRDFSWDGRPVAAARWQGVNGTDSLDANGRVEIRVPADSLEGTRRVSFSVAVEDVNRQQVTSSRDEILFGSAYYLALRDGGGSWWWRTGTPVRIEVLAVRPDGSRVPGRAITARLVHARWLDSSGVGSSGRWISDTVATWPVVSADTAITVSFTPRAGGYYTLHLIGRDSAGRNVESRIRRYVGGGAVRTPNDGPAIRLPMEAGSADHLVGSTATIRVDSPFADADALVTVEREGLLRHFRQTVRRGPNDIRIVVSENMAPASLVGVVLLNRGPLAAGDSLHRRLRTGMVRLRVDSLVKRLSVTVGPEQREVAPGSDTRIRLHVRDYRGRGTPAAVTVWAVDEGVLSMGSYERPDPAAALQAQHHRWLALASTLPSTIPAMDQRLPQVDLRGRERANRSLILRGANRLSEVVVTGVGAAWSTSGAGGQPSDVLRQDFRTTAFFRGVVLTDASGSATVAVRLPDNITTYRLFAVAVGADDRAGTAESTLVATRPLVVRAALPRFVRPGDTFVAGAAIGARDGRPRDVRVATEATGISITSTTSTTLRLGNTDAEARFSWEAREGDSARVTLAATDGTSRDAVRTALPIKPDRFPLARSISGVVRDTLTVRITMPRDIDLARSRLTLRAGTTPLTLIDEAHDYLASYPYACTEQLLASARVWVASLMLQRAGLPTRTSRALALGTLQAIIDQLARRQRPDGAFGYWSSDSWSTPWLSTSVGLVLLDAADAGARVEPDMKERLTAYLARSLDSLPVLPDTTAGSRLERRHTAATYLSERLAAASFLRRAGWPRVAEERMLLVLESLLAWEDRVLLAHLLSDAGRKVEATRLLDRTWLAVSSAGLRVDVPDSIAGRGLFPSRVRPVARLVEATVSINPAHSRLGALMERLVSRTSAGGRYWWNTQDYATAAAAVVAFTRVVPRGSATLTASAPAGGSGLLSLRTTDGAAVDSTIALTGLAEPADDSLVIVIRLAARNGPTFFGLTTHEVSAVPDTRPLTNGVTVERWYERFDNGEPAAEVREGELLRVRLRITVPSQRDFLAVEDPLPAGLEAVDLSLRTSGTVGPFSTDASNGARDRRDREAAAGSSFGSWDSGWWSPWEHSEKRDDRVTWFARTLPTGTYTATYLARATTAGRFIRPPSRAEEMYNTATSGRSDGGTFVVTERRR